MSRFSNGPGESEPRAAVGLRLQKVAAFQAPLLPPGSMGAVELIRSRWPGARRRVSRSSVAGGRPGAGDYAAPAIVIDVEGGQLADVLAPLLTV
jgi:hypothetical protein